MKVAIVGAQMSKWETSEQIEEAKRFISSILLAYTVMYGEVILVSGGCHKGGVDIWAEEAADKLGIDKIIFPAPAHQWKDILSPIPDGHLRPLKGCYIDGDFYVKRGYRSRNLQIASECDVIWCINPKGKRSGGSWTLKKAVEMGKRGYLVTVSRTGHVRAREH